jgi:Holliday junction resolvasome RuvABC ATP-dependent DNA helicase subunit
MKTTYFKNIVGQDSAKKKLTFYIDNYKRSGRIAHTLFNAPKGTGKTMLARTVAANLSKINSNKQYIEVNCATIKTMKQFCEQLLLTSVVDKDVTVLFDEASELPKSVTMALLTILNPNEEATTEAHKMFHALKDRLNRIDLQAYTQKDIADILALNLDKKKVKYDKSILLDIASVLRGNARQAVKMSGDIIDYMHGSNSKFTAKNWEDMRSALDILPMGISPVELNVLEAIGQRNGTSLTQLSAITGMSRESLQKDGEMFLLQNGLMEIRTPGGRCITSNGIELLKQVNS